MKILALDTSFDDTAAAVLDGPCSVLSSVVSSQHEAHRAFGGVVPEVASRLHVERILPAIDEALARARLTIDAIDAVAVTNRPGLLGSLLVGLDAGKAVAFARRIPLVCVHHIEAHLYALFLDRPDLRPPVLCVVASGGHTSLVLLRRHGDMTVMGRTLDDAAGEAFDKVARAAGLELPGGPALSALADRGDPAAVAMPVPEVGELDFSFSGLKTHAARLLGEGAPPADVAAAFQRSVVTVLVRRMIAASRAAGVTTVGLGGGVAANAAWRSAAGEAARAEGLDLVVPPFAYCTDNAAMVGCLGHFMLDAGLCDGLETDAASTAAVGAVSFEIPPEIGSHAP
jgi:N6-L-threonylcarbamoyladenine synthase